MRLVNDPYLDPRLRGRAAASLPTPLSTATCSMLRDLVRTDSPPAPLLIGVLQALGHTRDAAALPVLMRYSLDQRSEIAQTAVAALAAIGDGAISPMLVRVALSPQTDAAVKLVAIESLLRLGEPDAARCCAHICVIVRSYFKCVHFVCWQTPDRSMMKRNG